MANNARQRSKKEAAYYQKSINSAEVTCRLCPRACRIKPGETGYCNVRYNRGGVLYVRNYGWLRAMYLEHIEKLPLVEYYSHMGILMVGSFGCNLYCPTCCNRQLVEEAGTGRALSPGQLAEIAAKLLEQDNIGIAYAFNEPTVWYEFVLDCAKAAREYDLQNILATNGLINREPLLELLPYIDAVNLSIKSMDMEYYDKALHAPLATVLENAKLIQNKGKHLEISYVVIPELNDSAEDIRRLTSFIAYELGRDTPLHLLAHLSNGRTNFRETTEEELMNLASIADQSLTSVYIGTP